MGHVDVPGKITLVLFRTSLILSEAALAMTIDHTYIEQDTLKGNSIYYYMNEL